MCGIAGIWNFSEVLTSKTLEIFTNLLKHRGPDGSGFYLDETLGVRLGHRRLAILDLSEHGKQLMSFSNNRYWITYNGEIFNFIELRQELREYGYEFHSQSDTEIIPAAYHKWEEDCQYKFNGMWAYAILDKEEKIIFLSCDRFELNLYVIFTSKKNVLVTQ